MSSHITLNSTQSDPLINTYICRLDLSVAEFGWINSIHDRLTLNSFVVSSKFTSRPTFYIGNGSTVKPQLAS